MSFFTDPITWANMKNNFEVVTAGEMDYFLDELEMFWNNEKVKSLLVFLLPNTQLVLINHLKHLER